MGYFYRVNKCKVREVCVSFDVNNKSHELNYRRVHMSICELTTYTRTVNAKFGENETQITNIFYIV